MNLMNNFFFVLSNSFGVCVFVQAVWTQTKPLRRTICPVVWPKKKIQKLQETEKKILTIDDRLPVIIYSLIKIYTISVCRFPLRLWRPNKFPKINFEPFVATTTMCKIATGLHCGQFKSFANKVPFVGGGVN